MLKFFILPAFTLVTYVNSSTSIAAGLCKDQPPPMLKQFGCSYANPTFKSVQGICKKPPGVKQGSVACAYKCDCKLDTAIKPPSCDSGTIVCETPKACPNTAEAKNTDQRSSSCVDNNDAQAQCDKLSKTFCKSDICSNRSAVVSLPDPITFYCGNKK